MRTVSHSDNAAQTERQVVWSRHRLLGTLASGLWLGCLLGLLLSAVASAQQNLPRMGEPADSALSPQQEKLLGREFMRQVRAQLPLIRDTEANEEAKKQISQYDRKPVYLRWSNRADAAA